MTTDSRERAASESPANPGGRLQDQELSVDEQAKVQAGEVTSEKLASPAPYLPLIEASPILGAVAGLENPLPRQAEELRGSVPPGDSQPGGRCLHASIGGSTPLTLPTTQAPDAGTAGLAAGPLNGARNPGQAPARAGDATAPGAEEGVVGSVSGAHEMPRPEAPTVPETAGEPGMPGGAAPSGPAASHVPSSGVATFVPVAGAPATGPTGHGGAHCDRCGWPSAGTMCEPCLRYELVRPGRLLAYTSSEVDDLAEAADAAARYWTGIAAWLRTEAARRAE